MNSIEHYKTVARDLAVMSFAQRAARYDETREYCWANVKEMASAGLMGLSLPVQYGGQEASVLDIVTIAEEIAKHCTLTARVFLEGNLGAISAIMHYGTHAQKKKAAALVLVGDKPAICITEPEAGSAATDMRATAHKVGNRYILNGEKHWITGGGVSKLYLVFARVIGEDGRDEGINGFIVINDFESSTVTPGFEVLGRERTMGLCGMPEAHLRFDNVVVEEDMRLSIPGDAAGGFAKLMQAYNTQRIGAGAIALGVANGALEEAKRYMKQREQFGRPIAEFQGLQWMIADMDTAVHASRLLLHEAAKTANPFPDMASAARAKLFASEQAIKVVNQALQIFGARGYGAQEKIERMYRDVRMFTIGGGTAEILRNQIAGHVLGMKPVQRREANEQRPRPRLAAAE